MNPILVSQYMSAPVFGVGKTAHLEAARALMDRYRVSCLAVRDDNDHLVGAISRKDLVQAGGFHWLEEEGQPILRLPNKPVSDLMRHPVVTVALDDTIQRAAQLMVENRIHRVFVSEGKDASGVFSTLNLMRTVVDARLDVPAGSVASSPVVTVDAKAPVADATERMREAEVSGIVAVGEDQWPVGVFTLSEALTARGHSTKAKVQDVMSTRLLAVTSQTTLHHAAAQVAETRARRVVVVDGAKVTGILSGLDFARAVVKNAQEAA